MSEKILRLENITMQFGGVIAVNNMNLEVGEGEIVSLIGPNGAGKTTAFNVITGVYQPTNGAVWYRGEKIVENYPQGKMRKLYKGEHAGEYTHVLAPTPDKITRMGMARTFQNIRLWKDQTVFNNVLTAMHCRSTSNLFTATFRLNRKEETAQRRRVSELLDEVGLSDVAEEKANSLPYGKQRWRRWGSAMWPGRRPIPCPTASSGGWRSPGPWPRTPSSCCWMSRRRA